MQILVRLKSNLIRFTFTNLVLLSSVVFGLNETFANNSDFCINDNHIVVSPIGNQEVIAGGGISIYFTAIDPVIGGAEFSSIDLPTFGEIVNNGDNTGKILINTTLGEEGVYSFHLTVNGSQGTTIVPILLTVLERAPNARVFYSDPESGSMSNVGDSLNPWSSLQDIFTSNITLDEGDIIFLRDGYHGKPDVKGQNDGNVYIAAQANHYPKARRLTISYAKNWIISGLEISPRSADLFEKGNYVFVAAVAKKITIKNCHIFAIKNSNTWLVKEDWYVNCGNGIYNKGEFINIKNNLITNTYFSITVEASHNHFDYNIIDRFAGDAIRGIRSYNTFNYNTVTNAVIDDYDIPPPVGNHDDAFQSWVFDGSIRSIEFRGNVVFSCTDPDLLLKTSVMQGVVIFDGFAEDWIVENNLIILDHPHGIALYGAKNCKVVNNTVIRNPLELFFYGSQPWVRINPHKDGRVSTGNLVRNNLSGAIALENTPGTADHNTVNANYDLFFNDYDNWDFYLKNNASVINTGFADDAPKVDLDKYVRSSNDNPDRGCFEAGTETFDTEDPSEISELTVVNISESGIHLSWTAATDNSQISHYNVLYQGEIHPTTDTDAYIHGLIADTNYDFTVVAVDYSGNNSVGVAINQSTDPRPFDGPYELLIPAHRHDQQIRSNNKLDWVGLYQNKIGGVTSNYDVSAVIPFQLPILEEWEEIKTAKLELRYTNATNPSQNGVALYGLPSRASSAVKSSDHWQGPFSLEDHGVGLIPEYISAFSTFGPIPVSTLDVEQTTVYINAEYSQGAEGGDYIFFRLNSNVTNEPSNTYFVVGSQNEPQSINRPFLALTIGLKPNATDDKITEITTLKIAPNPLGGLDDLSIHLPEVFQREESVLRICDFTGRILYTESIQQLIPEKNLNLEALKLTPGVYQISIQGAKHISQATFIIQ